jgi:hypothetical protein
VTFDNGLGNQLVGGEPSLSADALTQAQGQHQLLGLEKGSREGRSCGVLIPLDCYSPVS